MRAALNDEWSELVMSTKVAAEAAVEPRSRAAETEHRRDELERMRQWNQVTHRNTWTSTPGVALEPREKKSFSELLDALRQEMGSEGKKGAWEEEIVRMW